MSGAQPKRQHLIDPEICIRCNTCEESCPIDAVTHNDDNYVVDADKCEYCLHCISPCPTGAIDNWRSVSRPYSLEEQMEWEELPPERQSEEAEAEPDSEASEPEAASILEFAHAGQGGSVVPPFSASKPYINVFTRAEPAIARVMGNRRITDAGTESDVRHIVLDFGSTAFPFLEGQSIGIVPPGTDDKGRAHAIRLYSVASPRDGERTNHNNLALSVKRVVYTENGEEVCGLASNYLCDLERGAEVKVTGPFGNTFLMPNHPEANLIMICTGTGAAPFRAMTERRRRHFSDVSGKLLLLFGARTPGELPYFGPLNKLPERLIDRQLVFSRLPGQDKEYVQDRMRKHADVLAEYLKDENTFVFICGLKGMEQGVDEAFAEICRNNELDWAELSTQMKAAGRYHVETY